MNQDNAYRLRSGLIAGLAIGALVASSPGMAAPSPGGIESDEQWLDDAPEDTSEAEARVESKAKVKDKARSVPAASPTATTPETTPSPATPQAVPPAVPGAAATTAPGDAPMIQPLPVLEPVMHWDQSDASDLLTAIEGVAAEGLIPTDYRPDALRTAIEGGEGPALDKAASKSFSWLVEDLRDGRTPMKARVQWFAVDPDQDILTTESLMRQAVDTHDVKGVLMSLTPTHPDYAELKAALAATPKAEKAKRNMIRANMDRWRWLARDLGPVYLMTNVPEFQLRLTVNNDIIRTYKTIVGKPGRTATPQLAETVSAVVFNPTWTVPQSIVKGEGMGARLLRNPASAKRQGYRVSRASNGFITVVQQPGPNNALGLMKIDMPNPHAIYLHDTPSKGLFNTDVRAYSHGCIRTERAVELGMTMAMLGAGMTVEEAVATSDSGKYTKVEMTRTFPVYITYFTMGRDINGKLSTFKDIYERDAPVIASFNKARETKTTQRKSNEEIIKLDNPL